MTSSFSVLATHRALLLSGLPQSSRFKKKLTRFAKKYIKTISKMKQSAQRSDCQLHLLLFSILKYLTVERRFTEVHSKDSELGSGQSSN